MRYILVGLVIWTLLGWWTNGYIGWLYYRGETSEDTNKWRNLWLMTQFWGSIVLSLPYLIIANLWHRFFKR